MTKLPPSSYLYIILIIIAVTSFDTTNGIDHDGTGVEGQHGGGVSVAWVLFDGKYTEEFDWVLKTYTGMASGFVHAIAPLGFPWEPLINLFSGSADIVGASLEIVKSEGGVVTVSLILLLLGILIPISGIFFCLCRCCGKCGAVHHEDRVRGLSCCTGVIMGTFIFAFSLIVVVAGCFTILSGERLSQSVTHFEGTVNTIMDDVQEFQGNLITDLRQVGNISFIVDNIKSTLDDAENAIFDPMIMDFDSVAVPVNDSVTQLREDLTNPLTPLASTAGVLATLVDQIQTDGSAYQTAVSAVSASLVGFRDTDCAGSLPDSLYSVCSFIPDETPFITTVLPLSMLDSYNFTGVVVYPVVLDVALTTLSDALSAADTALNEFKTSVATSSDDAFQDVGAILDTVEAEVTTITGEVVSGLETSIGESLDTEPFRAQISEYVYIIQEFDMYSYVVFLVFACLAFVMAVLAILGVLFGAWGYKETRRPSERSSASECGGQFMVGSSWWIFVFAILFCLPSAIWFILGANVTLMCTAMVDYSILDKVVDNPVLWGGSTLLDSVVQFGDAPLNLTARQFIKDCEQNQTVYSALHLSSAGLLDGVDDIDINEIMPFVDTFTSNITDVISGMTLLGPVDLDLLIDAIKPPAFPIHSLVYSTEILKETTEALPIQEAINELNIFINKTWEGYQDHGASEPDFQAQVDFANDVINELNTLESARTALLAVLTSYGTVADFFVASYYEVGNLTTDALIIISSGSHDLQAISADASNIITLSLGSYVDGIVSQAEGLITEPISKIENDIGKCGVVARAYDSAVSEVCVHFLMGFNALWFSTGIISLLCLPILILNVLLSKYVLRAEPAAGSRYEASSPPPERGV
ncbi:prominin-1-like [Asterias amurensis]|uniref:prominin-1-like n=1 Tax=Asterias amurensis TaxID=7602 RepID=UPI003AB5509C